MTAEERARKLWTYLQADAFKGSEAEYLARHLEAADRQGYLRGVKHSARTVDAYACSGKYVVGYGFLGNLRDLETHIRKLAEGIQ